ncbi:MAG: DotU family type IV/VI secretion system protein [Bryobacterales bacterium]
MSVAENPQSAGAAPGRSENLALVLQELITAVVRLRSGRQQVTDADVFRRQVLQAIQVADRTAREKGYPGEDIRLAIFAVVAFLDETILNLRQPVFQEWVRKPLQEEIFGRHVAGEAFFENLDGILSRRETETAADLLEVYQICLLLGYLGKFSITGKGELRSLIVQIQDKIQRIRKSKADLSPSWRPPAGAAAAPPDPWAKRFLIALVASLVLAIGLFSIYTFSLSSGVTSARDLAGQARQ